MIAPLHQVEGFEPQLIELLQNAVEAGGSIGFHHPLSEAEAREYWQGISRQGSDKRLIWAAFEEQRLVGCVQLELCPKANGRHRAEVQKLMVHTDSRGRGVGRALMLHLEKEAKTLGRTLLILDTRAGDIAEKLYTSLGYQKVGNIPNYVLEADGSYADTAVFYKG